MDSLRDVFVTLGSGKRAIQVSEIDNGITQNNLLVNRPMTTTGMSAGNRNINPNASLESPIDYFVEALPGERLSIARIMIHVVDSGSFDSGSYGNGITVPNGIQVFYRRNNIDIDVTGELPIKTNVDWSRWCYDLALSEFGGGNETLDARWSLNKYGTPYGIVLEEGDRLGVRIRDNLSGLVEQTIIAEGVHFGIPSQDWIRTL